MTEGLAAGFVIVPEDSAAFARLSGDFNPLHVDAVAARRLLFGSTVCHGVHLVLLALEALARDGVLAGRSIQGISAVFHQPVRTGVAVQLSVAQDAAHPRTKVSGLVDGRVQFSAQIALGPATVSPEVAGGEPSMPRAALEPAFPADAAAQEALAGAVPLRVNDALFRRLFPALGAWPDGRAVAADLMATTHIVGMRCPGLHSIYSEFKVQRRTSRTSTAAMTYGVARADPRFRKVRVALQGLLFEGHLEAFFRAPPVAQRSLAEVAALTRPGCVAGQRALVVGGSRGLGELVAKMLLAGDAEVSISYTRGQADAEATVAQAAALGTICQSLQLDTAAPLPKATAAALAQAGFTHLYYFATPAIRRGASGTWNQALFDMYSRVYVAGLAEVARAAAGTTALHVFYPSTVFLDRAEKDFAEYCAAKAAGETLCDHLALDAERFVVQRPRLPRMKTDQNSSFLGPDADDPFPTMAHMLRYFCGWQAAR